MASEPCADHVGKLGECDAYIIRPLQIAAKSHTVTYGFDILSSVVGANRLIVQAVGISVQVLSLIHISCIADSVWNIPECDDL